MLKTGTSDSDRKQKIQIRLVEEDTDFDQPFQKEPPNQRNSTFLNIEGIQAKLEEKVQS